MKSSAVDPSSFIDETVHRFVCSVGHVTPEPFRRGFFVSVSVCSVAVAGREDHHCASATREQLDQVRRFA